MKIKYSLLAILLVSIVVVSYRFIPERYPKDNPLVVTTWDALGYYIYLPAFFVYHDYKELRWFPEIDKKYSVSGGWVYQANKQENGNYLFSYLAGIAILELPFFLVGHFVASTNGYPVDGFSPPYQFAIAFGAILYFILSLFLLRKILLRYFNEGVTTATLLILVLATNLIQYISVDGAMSHSFIFPLYVLLLWFTIRWHERPGFLSASMIGATIGLAIISRPTEAVMFFIPLLWNTQTKESKVAKWAMVRNHKSHIWTMAISGFIAILPQLIYWKLVTGSFFYEVPSRWDFLNPHFRVLFGWETGWFIYTPVAIFFIIGMFFIKKYPFRYSVTTFCILSIYIVISHHDWRYGATYSCRALSHMYPVFALPLAAFIQKISGKKIRYLFILLALYLVGVNLFQIRQYNKTILHYRDMNRKYYCSIYLDPNPTPLDMSLLDTNDIMPRSTGFLQMQLRESDTAFRCLVPEKSQKEIFMTKLGNSLVKSRPGQTWLRIEARIKFNNRSIWETYLNSELKSGDSLKRNRIRLINPLSQWAQENDFAFDVSVPVYFYNSDFRLFLSSSSGLDADIGKVSVRYFYKP